MELVRDGVGSRRRRRRRSETVMKGPRPNSGELILGRKQECKTTPASVWQEKKRGVSGDEAKPVGQPFS